MDTPGRVHVAETREPTDSGRPAQLQGNFKNLCGPVDGDPVQVCMEGQRARNGVRD